MQKSLYLSAFRLLGTMTAVQLSRFIIGSGEEPTDMVATLADMVEAKQLKQSVSLQGIVYSLTEKGKEEAQALPALPEETGLAAKAGEFRALFDREKDYLAQYTQSATAIVPVFLSIRDGANILMQISVIVENLDQAKKICSQWMERSHGAYEAVWGAIAGDEPVPVFYTKLLEKEKNHAKP
jgi:hypothetical protein